jgi:FO synthase subunit 1
VPTWGYAEDIVAAHASSPGKRPDIRRDFIALAGKMRIPFTTGILVGIGESQEDRRASLQAIADLHRSFDHIQEVIVQPLDPKPGTALVAAKRPGMGVICETVKMAREILPGDVALQIPPNLIDPLPLIEAGANDLGGISTVTPDWINPRGPTILRAFEGAFPAMTSGRGCPSTRVMSGRAGRALRPVG